jgi:nitrate reductase NapE component
MTQTQQPVATRTSILSPAVTAAFGFVVYALAMICGEVFE